MAKKTLVSLYSPVPVAGTSFKYECNQEVHVCLGEQMFSGQIIRRASHPSSAYNQYQVKLDSGVYSWYGENQLVARKYFLFDRQENQFLNDVYLNRQDAIDAEEDIAYDFLETQLESEEFISPELEIWEVDQSGQKLNRVMAL